MQSKLTLSINKQVIKKAKRFAKQSNRSLSEIIDSYLNKITAQHMEEVHDDLSEIIGVIKLPKDFDEKEEIRKILHDKYL